MQVWTEYGRPSHADLTIDDSGNEVSVGISKSDPDKQRVISRRLSDGEVTVLTDRGFATHTSARNLERPGWVYVTYGGLDEAPRKGWNPFHGEVVAVKLDGSKTVERLAHTHSWATDFNSEADASPSPDGKKVIWASNWGAKHGYVAAYVLELCSQ